MIGQFLTV